MTIQSLGHNMGSRLFNQFIYSRAKKIAIVAVCLSVVIVPAAASDQPKIIGQDGPLVKTADGIVHDMETGLEWFAGPDRKTSWQEARTWVSTLTSTDQKWRMPTRNELQSLARIADGVSNITILLKNDGYWIWMGNTPEKASKWVFRFSYGGEGWVGTAPADGGRVLAVRGP